MPDATAAITITTTAVLWLDSGLAIHRVDRESGETTLVAVGNIGPIGFAADDEQLYFTRTAGSGAGELVEVTLASGDQRAIGGSPYALGLAVDEAHVFGTSCSVDEPGNGIWRVEREGGEPATLVANTYCPVAIALSDGYVYYSDDANPAEPIGVRGVLRAPTGGGNPEFVTASATFAVADGVVYASQGDAIVRATDDGERVEVAHTASGGAVGIAIGDDTLYWTEAGADGTLTLRHAALVDEP
jgi:hypothetical protein